MAKSGSETAAASADLIFIATSRRWVVTLPLYSRASAWWLIFAAFRAYLGGGPYSDARFSM
jgi:hypothetical protein